MRKIINRCVLIKAGLILLQLKFTFQIRLGIYFDFIDTFGSKDYGQFCSRVEDAKHLVILTGHGVTNLTGIFTDKSGYEEYWRRYPADIFLDPLTFNRSPSLVWEFFHHKREHFLAEGPNEAHKTIAKFQKVFEGDGKGRKITILSNAIDSNLQRAGVKNVVELQGNLFTTKCTKCNSTAVNTDSPICEALRGRGSPDVTKDFPEIPLKDLPRCKKPGCDGLLRPGIPWYGEVYSPESYKRAVDAVKNASMIILIGTTCVAAPVYQYAPGDRGVPIAEFSTLQELQCKNIMFKFIGFCDVTVPHALNMYMNKNYNYSDLPEEVVDKQVSAEEWDAFKKLYYAKREEHNDEEGDMSMTFIKKIRKERLLAKEKLRKKLHANNSGESIMSLVLPEEVSDWSDESKIANWRSVLFSTTTKPIDHEFEAKLSRKKIIPKKKKSRTTERTVQKKKKTPQKKQKKETVESEDKISARSSAGVSETQKTEEKDISETEGSEDEISVDSQAIIERQKTKEEHTPEKDELPDDISLAYSSVIESNEKTKNSDSILMEKAEYDYEDESLTYRPDIIKKKEAEDVEDKNSLTTVSVVGRKSQTRKHKFISKRKNNKKSEKVKSPLKSSPVTRRKLQKTTKHLTPKKKVKVTTLQPSSPVTKRQKKKKKYITKKRKYITKEKKKEAKDQISLTSPPIRKPKTKKKKEGVKDQISLTSSPIRKPQIKKKKEGVKDEISLTSSPVRKPQIKKKKEGVRDQISLTSSPIRKPQIKKKKEGVVQDDISQTSSPVRKPRVKKKKGQVKDGILLTSSPVRNTKKNERYYKTVKKKKKKTKSSILQTSSSFDKKQDEDQLTSSSSQFEL